LRDRPRRYLLVSVGTIFRTDIFGVPSGKLLGFITRQCGIEANPKKISDITSMKAPT
jgi:hypothetical protein